MITGLSKKTISPRDKNQGEKTEKMNLKLTDNSGNREFINKTKQFLIRIFEEVQEDMSLKKELAAMKNGTIRNTKKKKKK